MKTALTIALLSFSFLGQAAITRTIDGIDYFLNYDFDSADGECVLRGKEYASSFYSYQSSTGPVAHLNTDGTVNQLVRSGERSFEIIEDVDCQ